MSVIIRLQGLPWSANAMDIRQYFQELIIPEGGVHIVGGDLGDAFIAFGTDEDARQAMLRDGGKIKDSRIKLLLSSRTEMQKVIEMARSQPMGPPGLMPSNQQVPVANAQEQPATQTGRWSPRDSSRRRENRSRERSKDRGRERRRNRSKSRSRSPRRSRDNKDRDSKRKDDRNRRNDEKSKRDDNRKRDDSREKFGAKRGPMEQAPPMRPGMMMPNGNNGMAPMGAMFGDRMNPNQGFDGPPERMMDWRNRVWDERPDGPVQHPMQPMDKKEWGAPMQPGPSPRGNRSRWNREPVNDVNAFRPDISADPRSREPFSYDRGPAVFGMRDGGPERKGRDNPFPGAGRDNSIQPEIRDQPMDRRDREPLLGMVGRNPRFESRNRDDFNMDNRMGMMEGHNDSFPPSQGRDSSIDRRNRNNFQSEVKDGGMGGRRQENVPPGNRDPPLRRSGGENFGPDAPRRSMDSDNRIGDYRGGPGASNGRSMYQPDRFEDMPSRRPPVSGLCVEMNGMDFSVSRKEILDFFHGLSIPNDAIKLYPDERGLKLTSAVVRFATEEDRSEALKHHRQYMGNRCVEIFACNDSQFDRLEARFSSNRVNYETQYTTCILIRGLPFNFKEDEIVDLFEGMKIVSVLMERDRMGDVTGNGFVEFDSPIDAKQAANSKKKIGHKYLELSLVGRERMSAAKNISEGKRELHGPDSRERANSPPGPHVMNTDCCLIQGLPFNATDRDIVEFFGTVGVMPVTIHIMLNKSSQPSGDAFCEFKSIQECEQALRKNKQFMGQRFIQVKPVMRKEMMDALGIPQHPGGIGPMGGGNRMDRPLIDRPPIRPSMDERSGGDRRLPDRPMLDRMPMDRVVNERAPLLENPMEWSVSGNLEGLPRGLQGFGKPGCVVGAKNIPYRASIDDMLSFFQVYGLTKENIIRRYNDKGQPTGEARIAFRSPSDAQKAVRELNQQSIGGRPCSLFYI